MKIKVERVDNSCHVVRRGLKMLDRQCFPKDRGCRVTKGLWWVISVDGDVAGYAGMTVKGAKAELVRAGVLRKHRGQALHGELIRVRLKTAKELGCQEAAAYTSRSNVASANNLIDAGFRIAKATLKWTYWHRTFP